MYIALSYRRTPYIEVTYTNYFVNSLNIYTGKTLVPDSSALFGHPSIDRRPYYNGGLFLNKSINPTSIGL